MQVVALTTIPLRGVLAVRQWSFRVERAAAATAAPKAERAARVPKVVAAPGAVAALQHTVVHTATATARYVLHGVQVVVAAVAAVAASPRND